MREIPSSTVVALSDRVLVMRRGDKVDLALVPIGGLGIAFASILMMVVVVVVIAFVTGLVKLANLSQVTTGVIIVAFMLK